MNNIQDKLKAFERLLTIMDELRAQCPWDKAQTLESLRTLTLEEVYELADAILKDDLQEIKKELGDILLHIVFYAKIGEEKEAFDIADVTNALCDKLVFRHPHIYGGVKVADAREVADNWEAIKLKEKNGKGTKNTVLGGVPESLPALVKANRIQDKARGVGFDWEERSQVWDKVNEELNELKHEIEQQDFDKTEAEFGDLFFSLINAARLYGINPENALERTNRKFIKRFNYLEEKTIQQGKSLHDMSLAEMDKYWEEAKRK
ncbi:MAG: nucleoside triphosphate pyrophosphohydrolase [Bacteroidales bacterium]|nr:nucleoside triphosphate pyrophosphohydrolase [Bacteroidales bacterium]MCF8455303.1 nucleoside triphosphate pyrophosphohydrolase [Bacteroidales bacterium]